MAIFFAALTAQLQAAAGEPNSLHFDSALKYHQSRGGQALVIMKDGALIFEHYDNGGSVDKKQILASGSKSFVGVAAAAAVDDGLIKFDEPACSALKEWKNNPFKSRITYRQLLNLTSGLEAGAVGSARSVTWKEIIAKPMKSQPGERFKYGPNQLNAFACALERELKEETFDEYLKRRVLDPLGVDVEWAARCSDGNPQVAGGAIMTARDWAVFGEFMRLKGKWKDRQIISVESLSECLVGSKANPAYGLTWWLQVRLEIGRRGILRDDTSDISARVPGDLFYAAGMGKQRLYVIPSMKLVIARLGTLEGSERFHDSQFLDILL